MARPTQVPGLDRKTSLAEAGPKLLAARFSELGRLIERLLRRVEPSGVHDLRVATRRLRVALALFPSAPLDDLSRQAKRLQDALGAVRDLEVEIEWLSSVVAADTLSGLLLAGRRRQVAVRERSLARTLADWRRALPPVEFRRALGNVHGKLGGKRMRSALVGRLDQVERRMEALRDALDARHAHRARIAVKKLRYLAELLEPAFPRASNQLLGPLAKAQAHLGELHDASVWAAHWSRERRRRRGASRLVAARLALLAIERMKRDEARVRKDVRRWHASRVASRVHSLLVLSAANP